MMGMKQVIKKAKERGWYLHRSKKHYIFKHDKGGIVSVSKTNSERRAWLEVKKDFMHQERIYNHGDNYELL